MTLPKSPIRWRTIAISGPATEDLTGIGTMNRSDQQADPTVGNNLAKEYLNHPDGQQRIRQLFETTMTSTATTDGYRTALELSAISSLG